MNYNQFRSLSCYEELEIQCALTGISKIDVLKEIGHRIDDYYFFISNDGIFNWYDLEGNYVEDPSILEEIKEAYIPRKIAKCVIPGSVTRIDAMAFSYCESLTSITIPSSVTRINACAFYGCKSLKEIAIHDSVASIAENAFSNCRSLKEIVVQNGATSNDDIEVPSSFNCLKKKAQETEMRDGALIIDLYAEISNLKAENAKLKEKIASVQKILSA